LKTEPSKAVLTSSETESHREECLGLLPPRGASRRKVVYNLLLLLMAAMVTSLVPWAGVGQNQQQIFRFLGNRAIPPFVSLQDGKPVGIVVDLAYALADKAGVPIIVEAMDWSAAQSMVSHGEADALLQINPNPQRELIYDFSDPLLESRFQIFRKVTRTDIQSLESLRGMKVGVESGGFPAQQLEGGGDFQLVRVPTWKAAFILLSAGQVDAVVVDRWVGEYELAINRFEDITVIDPPIAQNYSRIAVRKGNTELLNKINLGLKSIKQNGVYQQILDKWQPQGVMYFTKRFVNNLVLYAIVACGVAIVGVSLLIFNARAREKLLATLEERVRGRTLELENYQTNLEAMVAARTQQLAESNARLEAANKELEGFSYSVSHDLRTPLRAIDGFARLLMDEESSALGQEGLRLLNVIRTNTSKMSQLIDDMLAFSRMGQVELKYTDVDMTEVAQTAYNEHESGTTGRCIAFKLGSLPKVWADAAMMKQVFDNLLGNAIKYSAPTPKAIIEVEGHIQDGEAIYVIRDNGVGFDMKYAHKLFGVFQRLHGPSEFPGTGIGLSIIRRIITRHGGRVWADGKLGQGATFGFALPLQEAVNTA
jgi:signal transduction histidine kinase